MRKIGFVLVLAVGLYSSVSGQEVATQDTAWTIKGENTFLINQSTFTNWAAGGINSIAANLVLNYDFNYAKGNWNWDNKVIAGYGLSKLSETGWRKNDDRLVLNSLLGYKATEKWLYTFFANFNTQFVDGFNYTDEDRTLISSFFAPAYLSFGPGIAYKESDNFRFNLAPVSPRFVFVLNDFLSDMGAFGVDPGKRMRFEFGAYFDAYYKVNLMENVSLENILRLYSNYLEDPQNVDVDYTLNLFMKVNRFVSVNAGVQLIYDDNTILEKSDGSMSPGLQVKQIFGAGFTYKF